MVDEHHLSIGEGVYTEGGDRIGTVVDIGDKGITIKPDEATKTETSRGRDERQIGYGEAELMWRCGTCGEVGRIDSMPDSCPGCGAGKEELYYWLED